MRAWFPHQQLIPLSPMAVSARPQEEEPPRRLLGPRREVERAKALRQGGGNAATEKAVIAGLDWLARHEAPGGGWDADGFGQQCEEGPECEGIGKGQHGEAVPCPFNDAITALAVLAFLGHGVEPGGEGHGALVERGLKRLRSARTVWGLALATQAFAEADALCPGRWRAAAHDGAQRLVDAKQEDGGWGYAAGFRPGSDVPYTALVVQALVAARDTGFELPEDLGVGVDTYLDSLERKAGRLAYLLNGRRYGYTPTTSNAHSAFAIRHLLGVGREGAAHRTHKALVLKNKPVWKISFRTVKVPGRGKVKVQVGNLSMYQWWYGTIGCFQEGGSAWQGWFGKVKSALLSKQHKTGCKRGSWDPKGTYERQTGGRVFSTALGVLMLEQPYRHARLK